MSMAGPRRESPAFHLRARLSRFFRLPPTLVPETIFDLLARNSTDVVSLHDEHGVMLSVSPGTEASIGSMMKELSGSPFWHLAREDDRQVLHEAFQSVARDGHTRYAGWRGTNSTAELSSAWFETRMARAEPDAGGSSRIVCITHGVGDRGGQLNERRREYDEGRKFLHRAMHGIYRSTVEGKFLYVNPALVRMLGYDSAEELRSIDMTTQLYAEPAERAVLIRRAREGRLGGWNHLRWKMKDGSIIVVRGVVNAVKDERGEILFFEATIEDVTESLRREEILRRNERMASLGTMLAGVAHELNNPLAAISGFAQIILRGNTLDQDDRAAVETINHEANRAARIVRDLQTFARERAYLQREEVDLNDVISYVIASQRYRMDTHGIQRQIALAPALPPIRAERAQVEQILINLIANATQALESITDAPAVRAGGGATHVAPTISVRTYARGADAIIEVEDNGPGISPENLPRIFDPFFTTRPEGEGTGLGLAVVHGIVNSYSGTLEVESNEGSGTLFRVSFPVLTYPDGQASDEALATAAGAVAPASMPLNGGPATRPLDILVVEDEVAIRKLLARYFESRGHAVVTTEDGVAALREAEQSAFDVVICDLRLPGIDGFEVMRRLRELPTGANCRCILMSGANSKVPAGPLREVLRLAAIIDKPFEIEQLRGIVEG
jgi:PAS domain S-box-containing protein